MATYRQKFFRWARKSENILMFFIFLAVLLAIAVSFPVRAANLSKSSLSLLGFPGDLFFRCLKMCTLPVIIFSLLSAVTSLDLMTSGKLGLYTIAIYLSSTLIASLIGVSVVCLIKPGKFAVKQEKIAGIEKFANVDTSDAMIDVVRNIFPDNIVRATIQQASTTIKNVTVEKNNETFYEIQRNVGYIDGSNFLGIIFLCMLFGAVITSFEERARPLIESICLMNDVSMRTMHVILVASPLGIFFLILTTISSFEDITFVFRSMGMMLMTSITGLTILWLVVYPTAYFIIVRKNPFRIIAKTVSATTYAFMLSSSSATLPMTFKCCEEKLKITPTLTRFMLPIGAICNMDGTAMHESVAALFVAQLNGIDLSFGRMLFVSLVGGISSIACSTVPGAGIIVLFVVLTATGLPTEDVGLFFMTDWLLSRFRTATNILGDCFACSIVEHWSRDTLREVDERKKARERQRSVIGDPEESLELISTSKHDTPNNNQVV